MLLLTIKYIKHLSGKGAHSNIGAMDGVHAASHETVSVNLVLFQCEASSSMIQLPKLVSLLCQEFVTLLLILKALADLSPDKFEQLILNLIDSRRDVKKKRIT